MKIEVTSDIQVQGWLSPIMIVTQNIYISRFERKITEREHKEILKHFDEFEKGCKVFLE